MPACRQALQPTRELARRLARHLPEAATLHVSGCAKGCAKAEAASITLTGTGDGFDLVRDGRAGDVPRQRRMSAAFIAQNATLLGEVP